MKTNMSMTVEFLAGTNLEQAINEAKQMAARLDLAYIMFKFNGKSFSIGENASVEEVISQYHSDFGSDTSIVAA